MWKLLRSQEYRWVVRIVFAVVLLASVPYIVGYGIAPPGYKFLGMLFNVDDVCVYLSWMRQVADGHFFLRNLFTTEEQTGHGFNLLFLFMGCFARITNLPLVIVFHIWRTVFGAALLFAIYGLSGIWLKDSRSRLIALLVTGLSAGVGWVMRPDMSHNLSVDVWQPEAITFMSIFLSPLFVFPTLLMVGVVYCLHRFTETRAWKHAVYAGLLLLLLSNIHTYDVITLGLVWAFYAVYGLFRRPRDLYPIYGGLAAAFIASPLAAYQLYFYYTEPIFRGRVSVPTLSPSLKWYLMGYGFLVPLALIGLWQSLKSRKDVVLLACWALAGFTAAYIPVSFQRKLIMGTHIPLSILAAIGLIGLADRLKPGGRRVAVAAVIAVLMISNVRFIWHNTDRVLNNESPTVAHVPLISNKELGALEYLRNHCGSDDIILAPPALALLIPGFSGKQVYVGHWGETANYRDKLWQSVAFFLPRSTNEVRAAILKAHGITYVLNYHSCADAEVGMEDFRVKPVPYLEAVYETDEVSVYKVLEDRL